MVSEPPSKGERSNAQEPLEEALGALPAPRSLPSVGFRFPEDVIFEEKEGEDPEEKVEE